MADAANSEAVMQMATQIVVAYLAKRSVEPDELPAMVSQVCEALVHPADQANRHADAPAEPRSYAEPNVSSPQSLATEAEAPAEPPRPAVPIDKTITDDHIISLEDGRPYRSLKRHLMARYGMTPDEYRRKWGLAVDYPMVAPSFAQRGR